MARSEQKIVQYLNEAHASEVALVNVLTEQIAMTPRGTYRTALERHHKETRDHAQRLERRLGEGSNPVQLLTGVTESIVGQALAIAKSPLDLIRGTGGEEKVLKNAKDSAATEALEIATYTAIERLATAVGDRETARLAASIRADEERMLAAIMKEIPKLTEAVVGADVKGNGTYDITKTGAADAVKAAGEAGKRTARRTTSKAKSTTKRTSSRASSRAKSTARQARRVPGVAQAEGQAKGAVASADDLPIAGYDQLNADEVTSKLRELSQIDLAKVDSYERKNQNRTTVLERIESLRGDEPWPGYDEQTATDVQSALGTADDETAKQVREYERSHKNRTGVLQAAERELSTT